MCTEPHKLTYEHVFQRAKMIDEPGFAAAEADINSILAKIAGCTVTIEEHENLVPFEDEFGWERNRKAGIIVFDTAT